MYGGIVSRSIAHQRRSRVDTASSSEIDKRLLVVLSEIDRLSSASDREVVETDLLHGTPQRFIACELQVELKTELDRLLSEQIIREEKCARGVFESSATSSPSGRRIEKGADTDADADDGQGCLACRGPDCNWQACYNTQILSQRKEQLFRELRRVQKLHDATVQSSVARSAAINGGDCNLMKEIAGEMSQVDSKLKLCMIDKELHRCYASEEVSPPTRSIHGYDTSTKRTKEAILALEHEHDKHVSRIAALETVDGILNWMLEGQWSVFGCFRNCINQIGLIASFSHSA